VCSSLFYFDLFPGSSHSSRAISQGIPTHSHWTHTHITFRKSPLKLNKKQKKRNNKKKVNFFNLKLNLIEKRRREEEQERRRKENQEKLEQERKEG
jgi:hypothetical protein